jgi:hypothetical protein
MRTLCLALLLALSLPGCSRFTSSGRMDRAYYKQLKQVNKQREKRRKELIGQQRTEMKKLQETPPPMPLQTVQSNSQSQ